MRRRRGNERRRIGTAGSGCNGMCVMTVKKLYLKYVINRLYEEGGLLFYFVSEDEEWTPDRSKARMFTNRVEAQNFAKKLGGPVKVEQVEIRK